MAPSSKIALMGSFLNTVAEQGPQQYTSVNLESDSQILDTWKTFSIYIIRSVLPWDRNVCSIYGPKTPGKPVLYRKSSAMMSCSLAVAGYFIRSFFTDSTASQTSKSTRWRLLLLKPNLSPPDRKDSWFSSS